MHYFKIKKFLWVIFILLIIFSACQKTLVIEDQNIGIEEAVIDSPKTETEINKNEDEDEDEDEDENKDAYEEYLEGNFERAPTRLIIVGENRINNEEAEISEYIMQEIIASDEICEPQEGFTSNCESNYDLVFYYSSTSSGAGELYVAPEGTDEWVLLDGVKHEAGFCANQSFHGEEFTLLKFMVNFNNETTGLYKFRSMIIEDEKTYVFGEWRNVPIVGNTCRIYIGHLADVNPYIPWSGQAIIMVDELTEFCEYCPEGWKN